MLHKDIYETDIGFRATACMAINHLNKVSSHIMYNKHLAVLVDSNLRVAPRINNYTGRLEHIEKSFSKLQRRTLEGTPAQARMIEELLGNCSFITARAFAQTWAELKASCTWASQMTAGTRMKMSTRSCRIGVDERLHTSSEPLEVEYAKPVT
jgi:hypothetical protein